jgi:ABC-2 type transport system permease protein
MIGTIAGRELRNMFLSPLAWAVLAVIQFILAWMFLSDVDRFMAIAPRLASFPNPPGVTDAVAAPLFSSASIILLLVVPLLSMRLVSEERKNGTLSLIMSSPVSMTEIVLGKYLGLLAFLLIMLGLIVIMPLTLMSGTNLDLGKFFSGVLGLGLMLAAFAAAGLFMSTITRQPVVAAVAGFGLLLLLWIIDWAGNGIGQAGSALKNFSLLDHFQSLLKGTFNSADVIYYILFIVLFLVFSIRRLDAERLQH